VQNLYNNIQNLFIKSKYFYKDGKILKDRIVAAALKLDADLLTLLLADKTAKKHFFTKVDKVLVFDKVKFQHFIANKDFLPDSYTRFKRAIGLTTDDTFLSKNKEVVLSWAYKDSVLEGGQTKTTQKIKERFWNETLAADEIDRLFEPKLLINWKKFDKNGTYSATELLEEATKETAYWQNQNLLLKGNNLIALHSLLKTYRGKIKQIYIDPPYNTGGDGFNYNDNFTHSTWLTFMKNRLEIAHELLTIDGSIWLNIDDGESHYLKVLTDEIFGRKNFIINFIWQKKYSPSNDAKYFSDNHDHILVFAKDKSQFKANLLPRTAEMNARYKNPDNDPRGDWKPGGFSVKTYSKDYDYPIKTPSGRVVFPPKGSCWQTSKENYLKKYADNRIWFGKDGSAKPQLKQFLTEVQQGRVAKSIWLHDEAGHNQMSRAEILSYFGSFDFATPKPEKLLKRIIELGSNKGDYVLDFFAGSGTTQAVAMKMQRKFIGVEQMDYIQTLTVERLKKVIEGIDVGVTKEVDWKGGGSFVYAELMPLNKFFITKVQQAKTKKELLNLTEEILNSPHIDYRLNITDTPAFIKDLKKNNLRDIQKIVQAILDTNLSYLPFSEALDTDYDTDKIAIALTKNFYR